MRALVKRWTMLPALLQKYCLQHACPAATEFVAGTQHTRFDNPSNQTQSLSSAPPLTAGAGPPLADTFSTQQAQSGRGTAPATDPCAGQSIGLVPAQADCAQPPGPSSAAHHPLLARPGFGRSQCHGTIAEHVLTVVLLAPSSRAGEHRFVAHVRPTKCSRAKREDRRTVTLEAAYIPMSARRENAWSSRQAVCWSSRPAPPTIAHPLRLAQDAEVVFRLVQCRYS
mmetsp:Transcript_18097/g.46319  ORF Transcript_18097/g.46319 Transcript_18097/m.46319 type:complete len:226 (+) Transcript_18097:1842-2519(+)